jgi:hypothetical protein
METFKAATQYGDWQGSASADAVHTSEFHAYLEKKGLLKPNEFLVAVSLFASEHDFAVVHAFVFTKGGDAFESVKEALDATDDPVPVRRISIKMPAKEFLNYFKRFDVMLTWRGLELDGREYDPVEEVEG